MADDLNAACILIFDSAWCFCVNDDKRLYNDTLIGTVAPFCGQSATLLRASELIALFIFLVLSTCMLHVLAVNIISSGCDSTLCLYGESIELLDLMV